jgi:hypothetical protein
MLGKRFIFIEFSEISLKSLAGRNCNREGAAGGTEQIIVKYWGVEYRAPPSENQKQMI